MADLRDNQTTEAITAEIEADRLETFEAWVARVSAEVAEALDDLRVAERYVKAPGGMQMLLATRSTLAEAAQRLEALRAIEAQNG